MFELLQLCRWMDVRHMKLPHQQRLQAASSSSVVRQVFHGGAPQGPAHRPPLSEDLLLEEPDPLLQKHNEAPIRSQVSSSHIQVGVVLVSQRGKETQEGVSGAEPRPVLQPCS